MNEIQTKTKIPFPDLLKIDTQGSEIDILKGGNQILNNCKIIYFQHGNVDGVDKFDIYNNHIMSSTKYLTWGWDHSFQEELNLRKSKNIKKFYNIKSSGIKRFKINSNFENELVFFSCPIYKGIYF